jgi:hypothetical protein
VSERDEKEADTHHPNNRNNPTNNPNNLYSPNNLNIPNNPYPNHPKYLYNPNNSNNPNKPNYPNNLNNPNKPTRQGGSRNYDSSTLITLINPRYEVLRASRIGWHALGPHDAQRNLGLLELLGLLKPIVPSATTPSVLNCARANSTLSARLCQG